MFPSLKSRIVALGTVVIVAVLTLVWLLADASVQTRDSFRWVTHSATVIQATEEALMELRDAESGQRGFVLTRNAAFAQSCAERLTESRRAIDRVVALTTDNRGQNIRARELRALTSNRATLLQQTLDMARDGDFQQAEEVIAKGHGRELMATITLRAEAFLGEERALQVVRVDAADGRLNRLKTLTLIGGPMIAFLVGLISVLLIHGIRRPAGIIQQAMTALGRGEKGVRISEKMGSDEFTQLASGYNLMADQLDKALIEQKRSEQELQSVNDVLLRSSVTLRERGEAIELLGGMAHRMQAARSDEELAQVIRVFVPRVLPGISGALFAHNNSRNLLIPITGWGGMEPPADGFSPDQCWALRRGQSHFVTESGSDIVCGHVGDEDAIYHCEPLLAGGEVIGTLYLLGRIDDEHRFRLTVMVENIASALVNHRLQRGLREQTIRDPLTGLFNRRYMEETLTTEVARCRRSGAPLSLVMCDVDHFKRFNDEFGHDAGDVVLQAVATEMQSRFRDGDVVCRFGGEEFTIIAPGTAAAALASRVETVREAITRISLRQGGRALGNTSMSFGIAEWTDGMDRSGATLIQIADAALYRAKREGRNRIAVDVKDAA